MSRRRCSTGTGWRFGGGGADGNARDLAKACFAKGGVDAGLAHSMTTVDQGGQPLQ